MEEHTFPLPEQQVHALDELKDEIEHQRAPNLLASPWALLVLGLAVAALIAIAAKVRHKS